MVGDRVYVEGPRGVSPLVGQTDHGDDGEACGVWGVGIFFGGGGTRSRRLTPHTGVHLDTAGNHYITGVMPLHSLTLYQGREEAGYKSDDGMVGSGHGI